MLSLTISIHSIGQTYSKILEPFDLTNNILRDMEVNDNAIYISTEHICDPDSTDNSTISCTGLSLVNLNGDITYSVLIDTLFPEGFNRLLLSDNQVLLTGHHHEDFIGRSTLLYKFTQDSLILDTMFSIRNDSLAVSNNNGLVKTKNGYLLYGNSLSEHETKIDIFTADFNGQKLNAIKFSRVAYDNDCHDLQFTVDGNLIYANPFSSGNGAGSVDGQQIMILDTAFNKLDSLEFDGFIKDRSGKLRLLASSTGHIYCMTNGNPEGSILPSHGHVNKYSADLDTLLWSVKLPFSNLINERRYRIHDFQEAKNGDILATGRTWDASPNALQDQINNSFNGLLIRLSPEGEIKYLRVYKLPHDQPDILPPSEFGVYYESSLWNIHELDDGRLILGGTATYSPWQLTAILANDETRSFTWLMTVNENGCLDDEECQEVVIIDGVIKKSQPIFPIGTQWTYEYLPEQINPNIIEHNYITYEVSDTLSENDTTIYIINNNRGLPEERMIQGDNEIWFLDSNLNDWQLTYDFDAMISYETQYGTPNFVTNTTVDIDTVEFFTFGERGIVDLDKVTITDNGTIEERLSLTILDRCGKLEGGLRLGLGLNLFDPFYQIGELRCFEQDTFFYNFSEFQDLTLPCDTTWFDVLDNVDNIIEDKVMIYPNPTTGSVYIDGIKLPVSYQLYDSNGQIMRSGILKENDLLLKEKGTYIIRLKLEKKWSSKMVIRM